MNTKRNILPMLLAALLLFCLPMASLAEDVPIQNVSIRNTPIKGQILLEKTGQMQTTGEQGYLKGAVFEIRAAEDIVGQDGTQWYSCGELVATMTTSGEGVEKSPLLPLGKYTVKEISAPSGYVLDLTTYTVEIQASDQETPIVSATVSSINYPAQLSRRNSASKDRCGWKGTGRGAVRAAGCGWMRNGIGCFGCRRAGALPLRSAGAVHHL